MVFIPARFNSDGAVGTESSEKSLLISIAADNDEQSS